eukprot:scaffold345597_cov18-Prasinocladus_malaysianus.AAC.1
MCLSNDYASHQQLLARGRDRHKWDPSQAQLDRVVSSAVHPVVWTLGRPADEPHGGEKRARQAAAASLSCQYKATPITTAPSVTTHHHRRRGGREANAIITSVSGGPIRAQQPAGSGCRHTSKQARRVINGRVSAFFGMILPP